MNSIQIDIKKNNEKYILITGGLGYIGSHTCIELLKEYDKIIVIDNLSNSSIFVIDRIKKISNVDINFIHGDILDKEKLEYLFKNYNIKAVIHFAGHKSVSESVKYPIKYYRNNVLGSLILIEVMKKYDCKRIVFSSSATVYGQPKDVPVTENSSLQPINPYGKSKLMIEEVLNDLYESDRDWSIVILRYFNPVGAHESTLIGEDPNGIPNNLMPFISQVASGKRDILSIYGNDYNTPDGTGIRDYIHIVDLASAHVKALNYTYSNKKLTKLNIGTGIGYSVLEVVNAFQNISSQKIPYKFVNRRSGDINISFADVTKSKEVLNWKAKYDIKKMCLDSWNWQKNNPAGYEK